MKLPLQKIREAATSRPEGYYEHVVSRGVVVVDELEISSEALTELRAIYQPPSLLTMAATATRALASEIEHRITGGTALDPETVATRKSICQDCTHFTSAQRCNLCGCFIAVKAHLTAEKCPIGKW